MKIPYSKMLIALALLVNSIAFAGNSSGGGGYVKACYDNANNLTEVELLDIYEARSEGSSILQFANFDSGLLEIASKLYPENEMGKSTFISNATLIKKRLKRIPNDTKLEETDDALPVFKPKNCNYEQAVNFYSMQTVWIDGVLYDHLDETNKVALLVHESIYLVERMSGITDSRYARRVVGHLMSTDSVFLNPVAHVDETKSKVCSGSQNGKWTKFYLESIPKDPSQYGNKYRLSFFELNGHHIYTKKTAEVFLAPNLNMAFGQLESDIDGGETFTVSDLDFESKSNITLSWWGSDPGEVIRGLVFQCENP